MHPLHKSNIMDTNAYVLGVSKEDRPKPNLKSKEDPNNERNLENYMKDGFSELY
jgi:hypothetical protein